MHAYTISLWLQPVESLPLRPFGTRGVLTLAPAAQNNEDEEVKLARSYTQEDPVGRNGSLLT